MGFAIGINPTSTFSILTDGRGFSPGDSIEDADGKQYVFVKASAAINIYDVVTYDETYITTVTPVTTSNAARGDKLGVAAVAFASGDYGWLQVYGPCTINVATLCAPNVELTFTSVAGVLDDATTASLKVADNVIQTAVSASATVATTKAAVLNWPAAGRTL